MKLRDYQHQASDAIFEEWKQYVSTLIVLPTGAGKTIAFADVIRRLQPMRVMVLAHREELIYQAKQKIELFTGLHCEVEMADLTVQANLFHQCDAPVIISTIQTQIAGRDAARMTKFDPHQFGAIIIDEAHHATSESYRRVINYYLQNKNIRLLGCTATPDRLDEAALGQIFDTVAFDYSILDAIHDGWLVPVDQQMVKIAGLDFSNIRTTAGDLNGAELAALIESEENLQGMAGAAIEIIGDKRTIVFTASVKHAEVTCNILNRHRADMAEWISAKTEKEERARILRDFQSGKVQVVCNCGILLEGFDNPSVEVIIMGRPTESRSLYSQCCGRALRPLPGIVDDLDSREERKLAIEQSKKPSALIVDFVGNSGKHKLITSADILGGNVSDEAVTRAQGEILKAGTRVRVSDVLDRSEAQIEKERTEAKERKLQEEARKAKVIARVTFKKISINPFDAMDIKPAKTKGWHEGKSLSAAQRDWLQRQGIDPDERPYAENKQLLNEMGRRINSGLPSLKQVNLLIKHGYDPKKYTFKSASALITRIQNNGWRRPDPPESKS